MIRIMIATVYEAQMPTTSSLAGFLKKEPKVSDRKKELISGSKAKKSLAQGRLNLSSQSNFTEAFSFIDNLLKQK